MSTAIYRGGRTAKIANERSIARTHPATEYPNGAIPTHITWPTNQTTRQQSVHHLLNKTTSLF